MNKLKTSKNLAFILINHLAQDLGSYVKAENPTGGRAPVYLSDVIIQLTKKSSDLEKVYKLGQKVEFEVTKSRWGKGKCKIPFYICFGQGIFMVPTFGEILADKGILESRRRTVTVVFFYTEKSLNSEERNKC